MDVVSRDQMMRQLIDEIFVVNQRLAQTRHWRSGSVFAAVIVPSFHNFPCLLLENNNMKASSPAESSQKRLRSRSVHLDLKRQSTKRPRSELRSSEVSSTKAVVSKKKQDTSVSGINNSSREKKKRRKSNNNNKRTMGKDRDEAQTSPKSSLAIFDESIKNDNHNNMTKKISSFNNQGACTKNKIKKPIPVTLLSGFLGSGKTTLLKHILRNSREQNKGWRCAVIVNDMSEINVDADDVANSPGLLLRGREEELVRLENGCICCTLRLDLLQEVAAIAERGDIDYILIESSGISEPMQVAETFSFELPPLSLSSENDGHAELESIHKAHNHTVKKQKNSSEEASQHTATTNLITGEGLPVLKDLAALDTCVTVVDASNFFNIFSDPRMLGDIEEHRKQLPEGDTRTLTDLLCDQIEFADVILINKVDLLPPCEEMAEKASRKVKGKEQKRGNHTARHEEGDHLTSSSDSTIKKIENVIRQLNKHAKIITCSKSIVDIEEVVNTGKFSFERAAARDDWLQSLQIPHTPETVEYGIGSFVYRAKRPFHPDRFMDLLQSSFVIVESPDLPPMPDLDGEDEEPEEEEEEGEQEEEGATEEEETEEVDGGPIEALDSALIQERLNEKSTGLFRNLLRAKGVFWLATRKKNVGFLSQAGLYCNLNNGGMWLSEYPKEYQMKLLGQEGGRSVGDEEDKSTQRADHQEDKKNKKTGKAKEGEAEISDQRQEIVFIGTFSEDHDCIRRIRTALDACLLQDSEMADFDSDNFEEWLDPFEEWSYYEFSD